MSNTFTSASISMANAVSISNTISSNVNSISSLNSSNVKNFTNNLTSPVSSAIQDPVKSVLTKTLNNISITTVQVQKKIDDLETNLSSFIDKNSQVSIVGNNIVISVSSQDKAKGETEKSAIQSQINSIRNTLNVLQKSIGTLSTITQTIQVLLTSLTVLESLIGVNPIAKTAFTVFKQAIKVVFLKDMLNSYVTVISNQLSQSTTQLQEFTAKFMSLQVSLNVQDNSNMGNNILPSQAVSNVSQNLIDTSSNTNSQSYSSASGKTYILTVTKQNDNQLIGRAVESVTGLLAALTSPSYISTPDDLINELKTILNIQS